MTLRFFILVTASFLGAVSAEAKTLRLRPLTAFVGENLERTADCTIEIHDGRITQVIPGGSVPDGAGAEVIDATGKFVLPGFVEMHARPGGKDRKYRASRP